ncbi:MAG: hypothetical protein M3340_04045 [Actinomycetota bacterium]|nr:hypothetical protein [Actinomycetota bacterium]
MTVSWTASTLPGGGAVDGYEVRRYSTGGVLQSIGSGCSGTIASTSCTETSVPAGTWRYAIAVRQSSWTGSQSSQSSSVTVVVASMTVTGGSPAASLPATINASLTDFTAGQTVTYRLDDPSSGTLLSATTVPSTIPVSGSAAATITVPAGTQTGPHSLYAIGSGGEVAVASISIDSSFTTPAWSLVDSSSGSPSDRSGEFAYADGIIHSAGAWLATFNTARYIDFDMNAPLRSGLSVTGATFGFRRAAAAAGETECFYFEVRRASTGAVLATHGSAATPVACVTGTALTTVSTPIPSVTTADIANDLRIRVFERESAAKNTSIDMATVSGSTPLGAFTLYSTRRVDTSSGATLTIPWSLAAQDSSIFTSTSNWANSFSATRYLEMKFPAYVPASATVRSASFRHSFRPANSGNTECWYAEIYSGGALIETRGSAAAPISCATGTGWTTDTVTLDAVNTPARANDTTVRIYIQNTGGGNRRTEHDLGELTVKYGE